MSILFLAYLSTILCNVVTFIALFKLHKNYKYIYFSEVLLFIFLAIIPLVNLFLLIFLIKDIINDLNNEK